MFLRKSILLLISVILFFIFAYLFWGYSIDDAFITFRYAENLADGYGLVFNPGGEPVEGYSNFLWLLILALFYKCGLSTYLAAKILGIISFLLAGIIWFFYFKDHKTKYLWLTGPLFLICPITAFWAVSGLELGLHAFLIALSIIALLRNSKWLFLLLPLIILSRPEGIAIAVGMLLTVALIDWRSKSPNMKYFLCTVLIVLLTGLSLTVFRFQVFGYILPNTYYAKTYHNILWGYKELGKMLLIFLPMSIGLIIGLFRIFFDRNKDKVFVIFGVLFLLQVFISASIDPIMNFLFRYMIPFLPMMLVLSLSAVARISKVEYRMVMMGLFLVSLMIPLPLSLERLNQEQIIREAQKKFIGLANRFPENSTISLTDMGRIPFYTSHTYYDLWGLVNEETAHDGYHPAREFLRLPDYFVMVGYLKNNQINLRFERERAIAQNEVFPDAYELLTICFPDGKKPSDPGYYYIVFKRKPDALNKYKGAGYTYGTRSPGICFFNIQKSNQNQRNFSSSGISCLSSSAISSKSYAICSSAFASFSSN